MTDQSAPSASLLSSIAAIVQAVVWPFVIVLFFIVYRSRVGSLFEVLTKKLATATDLKIWQFELKTTEQGIQEVVEKTGEASRTETLGTSIPAPQRQAAQDINKLLEDAQLTGQSAVGVVQKQVQALIKEYEDARTGMSRGPLRTMAMNEIAAKMRALSLAARPLLRSLVKGQSVGERLAAICILQVAPEFGYFPWLIERIKSEDQPFVFFQAAVAVLELVRVGMYPDAVKIKAAIQDALQRITSFKDGVPDQNTIDVLNEAVSRVR